MKTTVIAQTTKGKRIWIQNTNGTYSWPVGAQYHTTYEPEVIVLQLAPEGKRKVSKGKGGIIDLVGKKVTQWAQGATLANITTDRATGRIYITRA